jgi:hypothetical protein
MRAPSQPRRVRQWRRVHRQPTDQFQFERPNRCLDASTGTTLLTLGLPGGVSRRGHRDGMVYASYGTLLDAQSDEAGGVRAYGLP